MTRAHDQKYDIITKWEVHITKYIERTIKFKWPLNQTESAQNYS